MARIFLETSRGQVGGAEVSDFAEVCDVFFNGRPAQRQKQAIAEAIVVASACELMRYRNPYERGSPAQKAWSELLGAVRAMKRNAHSASEVRK